MTDSAVGRRRGSSGRNGRRNPAVRRGKQLRQVLRDRHHTVAAILGLGI